MYHPNKLKAKLVENSVTVTALATSLGLSRYGLSLKVNGKREFKLSEIDRISRRLNLSSTDLKSIFFE